MTRHRLRRHESQQIILSLPVYSLEWVQPSPDLQVSDFHNFNWSRRKVNVTLRIRRPIRWMVPLNEPILMASFIGQPGLPGLTDFPLSTWHCIALAWLDCLYYSLVFFLGNSDRTLVSFIIQSTLINMHVRWLNLSVLHSALILNVTSLRLFILLLALPSQVYFSHQNILFFNPWQEFHR